MIEWKDTVSIEITYADYEGLRDLKRFINGILACQEKDTPMFDALSIIEGSLARHYCNLICQAREKFGLPE